MFKSPEKVKMSTHIIRQVREAILQGQLKPGEALPPEKDLIVKFGVSKHTLREALRCLEAMGFLTIRRGAGGGPVVSEVDMETTKDCLANFLHFKNVSVRDMSQVRSIIEPWLARRAAETFTEQDIEEFEAIHEKYRTIYAKGFCPRAARYEINFHIFLAKKTENPVLVMMLDFVNSIVSDFRTTLRPSLDFSRKVFEAHERIVLAIKARDGEAAARHMREHVREVEEELAALQSGKAKPLDLNTVPIVACVPGVNP